MTKKKYVLYLGILSVIIISVYVIVMQARENRFLRENIPHLLPGEEISYFQLIGTDTEAINLNALSEKLVFIYIFKTPCSKCNENVMCWNKMAKILKDKADFYGISLSGYADMLEISKSSGLNFSMYSPEDSEKFIRSWKLKFNIPQTIIYHNGKVLMVKLGNLNGKDYIKMLKKAKSILKS
jgi:peroxiredoxin